MQFTIYQYLPLTHHRGAVPIVDQLLRENHRPILDLEDSVSCIFDAARNDQLKATARKGLSRLADAFKDCQSPHAQILVRINQRDSHHYPIDIDAIVDCHQRGFSPSVLLPKTHHADDIRACQNDLFTQLKKPVQVLPLIESQKGIDSLEDILDAMPTENRVAIFGYFDYALDIGQWPLLDQTHAGYWRMFDPIRERAERKNCVLINSPYAQWSHEKEISRIKAIMLAAGNGATGMSSLGEPQTRVLSQPVAADRRDIPEQVHGCLTSRAQVIVKHFEAARCHQRSFAVVDGYFVTPHEYQLAKRYLQQEEARL